MQYICVPFNFAASSDFVGTTCSPSQNNVLKISNYLYVPIFFLWQGEENLCKNRQVDL